VQPRPSQPASGSPRERGFTLIEVMVVVAILAIVARVAMASLGALVPSTTLDAEAQKLMSLVDYLRSEAELQGKTYKLELDLDGNRYREVWPAEMKIALDQDPGELEEHRLGWTPLDNHVRFAGLGVIGEPTLRKGRVQILLDRNGNTSDQVIILRMKSEDLKKLVWTIQIHGLEPGCTLVRDENEHEAYIERIEEGHF